MENLTASRTALATALMRALHTRTDPKPLIYDPWGDRLVPDSVRATMADDALLRSPAFANVILRSRFTEDALEAAVRGGVRQYLELVEDLTGQAIIDEYQRAGTQGFERHSSSHVALARRASVV